MCAVPPPLFFFLLSFIWSIIPQHFPLFAFLEAAGHRILRNTSSTLSPTSHISVPSGHYPPGMHSRVSHLQFFWIFILFQAGIYARHTKEQEKYRSHMFYVSIFQRFWTFVLYNYILQLQGKNLVNLSLGHFSLVIVMCKLYNTKVQNCWKILT